MAFSDDLVHFSGILETSVDHFGSWDLLLVLLLRSEVYTTVLGIDLPANAVLHVVLSNEGSQLSLVLDVQHLSKVLEAQTFVSTLRRSGDLIANGLTELVNKHLVSLKGNILLGVQNLGIAALDEVLLEVNWHLDEDILQLIEGNELNLGVVL